MAGVLRRHEPLDAAARRLEHRDEILPLRATSTVTARPTSSAPTDPSGSSRAVARPLAAACASGFSVDNLRFGDFDGDGKTDVFSLANGQWSVSDGGATRWRRLNAKRSASLGELVFADFTGDGRTDIARRHDGKWEISSGGATPWSRLQSRPQPSFVGTLVGDFTGDSRADVVQFGATRPPPTLFADLTRYKLSGAGTGPLSTWSVQDMR